MKITLALLFACTLLAAETKTEAELRKQLEAARSQLAAEQAEKATSKASTQKLVEAVRDATETTKESGEKVEAVADRILESQESGKKAVEKVAAATQVATKKLTDAVTTQQTAVTSAISAQIRQQEKLLAQARENERGLESANRALAEREAASRAKELEARKAKEQTDAKLESVNRNVEELKFEAKLKAAKDEANVAVERLKLYGMILVPLISGVCLFYQIKAANQAKATHSVVNGRHSEALGKIERQQEEINRLRGNSGDGHPNT